MRDENAYAGEVIFAETPPEGIIETADTVVGIGGAFAIGDTVEEMTLMLRN